jgi:LysM domain
VPSDDIHQNRSVGIATLSWARSAVTSALLALAAVAPAASIAAEPDTSQEGGGAPEQVVDPDSDSPSFDPGGDTELPYDTGPAPTSPDESPDVAPLESEPLDDPEGRAAPFAEPLTPTPTGPQDEPAMPPEEPPAPSAPNVPIEPPPTAPSAPLAIPRQSLSAEPGSQAKSRRQTWTAVVSVDRSESVPADTTDESEPAAIVNYQGAPAVAEPVAVRPSKSNTDARIHTVRPGESLWSIAQGLLGSDASAMRIAAEVARLWELNRDRIPSGDPDLISVGQQLKLR